MKRSFIPSLIACLIAFALGVMTLSWRNLWGDEAFSVWASKQSAAALLRSLDTNPPGYYFSVAVARVLWGESVFAVRFISVCFGAVFVALAARLGKFMGGEPAAIACALAVALAPMTSYFEQEARMYTQALVLCAAAMWLTLRILQRGWRRGDGQALVVVSVLALFTHFYSIAILAVNAATLLGAAWHSKPRAQAMRMWVGAHGAIAILFGGWFFGLQTAVLRAKTGNPSTAALVPPLADFAGYAARGITGLLFGLRAEAWLTPIAIAAFLFLLTGALVLRCHRGIVIAWVVLPMLLALATTRLVPEFSPRYVIFALLPLAMAGLGWLRVGRDGMRSARWLARAPLAAMVVGTSLYGNAALFDDRWDKSQYRQALQTVRDQSNPTHQTDGLVLVNSDQFTLHEYYGPTNTDTLDTLFISNEPSLAAQNNEQFQKLVQTKRRIWLLNYGAAVNWNTLFEQQLKATALRIYSGDFGDASLALYDLTGGAAGEVQPRTMQFGEAIWLTGTRIRTPQPAPGSTLGLDLFWRATQKIAVDYTIFVHVRRTNGGEQIAANDSPPANGAAPTTRWPIGQVITDAHGVTIPSDAQPGVYNVLIGLYQYPSFERLKISGADTANSADITEFVVGQIVVAP